MRIKHFQGYGTVNAEKKSKTVKDGMTKLVIKVSGNHEYGLYRDDKYDIANWLVKRFDKNFTNYRNIQSISIVPGMNNGVETAEYTIEYFNDD